MKAIIVGGGIAGLSLALSLHQAGIAVRLYEAVQDPRPLGVGINLQPTAVRVLTELGLAAELAEIGIATRQLSYFNKFGQLVWSEPRGLAAGYRWPQYSIHRGHLQMMLLRTARLRMAEDSIRGGLRLMSFEQAGTHVKATFRDAETGAVVVDDGDILVGADGIHSKVRRLLYPNEGPPHFARQLLWRAAVDAEAFLDGDTMIVAGHFDQRVVVYPIGKSARQGQLLTNWICQMTVSDSTPPGEDWNRRVSNERILTAFGAWQFPWLDMPALIRKTPEIYEFPLVDRNPVDAWTFGRVTLVGDAAHPMQPIGSQAGSQAVIDARVLAAALLSESNPAVALKRYDDERRPPMNDIVLRNRHFGPEAALQLVEERAPHGFEQIDDVVSRRDVQNIVEVFSSAAGLDAKTVNSRPSFVPLSKSKFRAL